MKIVCPKCDGDNITTTTDSCELMKSGKTVTFVGLTQLCDNCNQTFLTAELEQYNKEQIIRALKELGIESKEK